MTKFRFTYPLEIDTAAGPPNSLQYYLYSDRLAWHAMRMDSGGVPRAWTRATGVQYWPAYIAWYGLVELGHYVRGEGTQHLSNFLKQIDWLEGNAVVRDDGAVVWAMNFDNPENEVVLRAPWISAHAQGLAISAMVRGWRVTKRPRLRELLLRSAKIFDLDVRDKGIRELVNGHTFYTEVPGGALPGILDGFMTSLLGLYDLYVETGDESVGQLFSRGVDGLKHLLPCWNYRDKWSWYGARQHLAPPAYHCQHHLLLTIIGTLTNDSDLKRYAELWNPANLSLVERAEIYLKFQYTKNGARLRYRTWLLKTYPDAEQASVPQT